MSVSKQQLASYFESNGNFRMYGRNANHMVFNAAEALNKMGLWYWIRSFEPKDGFVMSESVNVLKMSEAVQNDDHTSVSFPIMMRLLKKIANDILDD
jgi:hypothetical protein